MHICRIIGLFCILTAPSLFADFPRHWFYPPLGPLRAEKEALSRTLLTLPPLATAETEPAAGIFLGTSGPATSRWIQIDLESVYPLDSVAIVPAFVASTWGYGFPRAFRVELSLTPDFAEPLTLHTSTLAKPPSGPVFLHAKKTLARYLRITATDFSPHPKAAHRGIFCLGEIFAFSDGRNVALQRPVTAPGSAESLPTWSPKNVVDGSTALGLPILSDDAPTGNGWHSTIHKSPDVSQWVQVDLGTPQPINEIRLIPARPIDFMDRPGFGFPLRFRIESSESADFSEPVRLWDASQSDHPNPGNHVVALRPPSAVSGRFVRITATRLWQRQVDYVFALAELQVFSGNKNVALGKPVTALEQTLTANWQPALLVDNRASTGPLHDLESWLSAWAERVQTTEQITELAHRIAEGQSIADRRIFQSAAALFACSLLAAGVGVLWIRTREQKRLRDLREQIARDLHDDIGSSLGSIALMSEMAGRTTNSESLSEIHRLASDAAASMRSILWMVRETGTPDLARLLDALRSTATNAFPGIAFVSELPDPVPRIDLSVQRQIFLAFKEAVHNVSRHSKATSAAIHVHIHSGILHIQIRDNGCGFDPHGDHRGSGLANMHHRIRSLGGHIEITSTPETGTCLLFKVPVAK